MTDHPFVAHSTLRVPAAGEHALTAGLERVVVVSW